MQTRSRDDTHEEFNILKSVQPKAAAKPQYIKMEDGSMAKSPIECRQRWQSFFSQKLCGTITTLDALAESTRDRHKTDFADLHTHAPTVDDIPSIPDVYIMLSISKSNTGHGEDSLFGELHKAAARQMSFQLHPLALKVFVRLEEPVAFKGGMMAEILKPATSSLIWLRQLRQIV